MVARRRRSGISNPYLRSLNRADKLYSKQARYDAARLRLKNVEAAVGDNPSKWSFTQREKMSGRGAYGMYTGHGGFRKELGRIYRSRGMKDIGNIIKKGAMRKLENVMSGSGAYNSLVTTGGISDQVPSFSSAGDETGALTITHREYVTDVFGPTTSAFTNQSYALNPGLEQSFPWLSQIAANYEEYEFIQLMYTFRSTTTDIGSSTNGQCGTVIMCTNYNAAAPPFGDKITMMEYDAAMSCKVTEHMIHGVECDPDKLSSASGKYIRTNPVIVGQDPKTYDHGTFQFATANTPTAYSGFSLGEIWVSYTVKLRKPRFYVNRGLAQDQDVYIAQGTISPTAWMGSMTSLLHGQQNNIGTQLLYGTNTPNQMGAGTPAIAVTSLIVVFPASWAGQVRVQVLGTGSTITTPVTVFAGGSSQIVAWSDMWRGDGVWLQSAYSNAGTTGHSLADFKVSAAVGGFNNYLVLIAPTAATWTGCSLTVMEYNGSFSSSSTSAPLVMANPQNVVVAI